MEQPRTYVRGRWRVRLEEAAGLPGSRAGCTDTLWGVVSAGCPSPPLFLLRMLALPCKDIDTIVSVFRQGISGQCVGVVGVLLVLLGFDTSTTSLRSRALTFECCSARSYGQN